MKPNEYKAYRKMEAVITDYLSREEENTVPENRIFLVAAIGQILGHDLNDHDLSALDRMVEDEREEGTLDFSNLEKYGIYKEESIRSEKMPVPDDLTEQTLSMIRRQLADISYMEHYLADMKKELIEMSEKLQRY